MNKKKMEQQLRGTKHPPPKRTMRFYDRFPDLMFDDPEDEFNDLISLLRGVAESYFEHVYAREHLINKERGEDNACGYNLIPYQGDEYIYHPYYCKLHKPVEPKRRKK